MAIYSCKNCDKRYPGCHASCPAYKAEKEKHEQEKVEKDKARQISDGIYNQRKESFRKVNKWRKQRHQ